MVALSRCFWWENVRVILPRLLLTTFRYCQPLLISKAISFVNTPMPDAERRNEGTKLVILTFVIYIGIAVSSLYADDQSFTNH